MTNTNNRTQSWFTEPQPNHLVQVYQFDGALAVALAEYVRAGIALGDMCIVIATRRHQKLVESELSRQGIDLTAAAQNGQYLVRDADQMLQSALTGKGLPGYEQLQASIDEIFTLAARDGRSVRVYGEMAALLWKQANCDAVIQLEQYWEYQVRQRGFALYCAYPDMYFDGSPEHKEIKQKIYSCHELVTYAA